MAMLMHACVCGWVSWGGSSGQGFVGAAAAHLLAARCTQPAPGLAALQPRGRALAGNPLHTSHSSACAQAQALHIRIYITHDLQLICTLARPGRRATISCPTCLPWISMTAPPRSRWAVNRFCKSICTRCAVLCFAVPRENAMLLRAAPARALGPFARCVAPSPPTRAQVRLDQCRELLAAASLAPPAGPPQRPQPPAHTQSHTLKHTHTHAGAAGPVQGAAGGGRQQQAWVPSSQRPHRRRQAALGAGAAGGGGGAHVPGAGGAGRRGEEWGGGLREW